jgi:hypothetical protein
MAILRAIFNALSDRRKDRDRIDAHERAKVAEAEVHTQGALDDIADEVAQADGGDSRDDIIVSLRRRKSTSTSSSPGS